MLDEIPRERRETKAVEILLSFSQPIVEPDASLGRLMLCSLQRTKVETSLSNASVVLRWVGLCICLSFPFYVCFLCANCKY